jgi:hypothetical protein
LPEGERGIGNLILSYLEKVKTCIKETVSEYYLSGDINDLLNVELTCNDQVFFEILLD